jgi:twitching motility two-component system response regulator PilG
MQEGKVILVVEDDPAIGAFLVQLVREATPHYAWLATDAPQALALVRSLIPDLVIVDYWLPNMNGLELYERLQGRKELKQVPVLFMSANRSIRTLGERQLPFLRKPFELNKLLQTIVTMVGE